MQLVHVQHVLFTWNFRVACEWLDWCSQVIGWEQEVIRMATKTVRLVYLGLHFVGPSEVLEKVNDLYHL
jgi:hypothetical protein